MRVPKALQHLYPTKTFITQSLKTSCIKTARIRRDQLVGELATKKEKAFNNSRLAFNSYVETFKEAKEQSEREEREEYQAILMAHSKGERLDEDPNTRGQGFFEHMNNEDILHTEEFPDAQQSAYKMVKSGSKTLPTGFRPTLQDALDSWLKRNLRKNSDTISKMNSTTKKFLNSYGQSDVELEAIHRRDVLAFIEEMVVHYSISTIQGNLSRLRTVFKHSWQIGMIDRKRLANHTYNLIFHGNKLSISGSGLHSSSRQALT